MRGRSGLGLAAGPVLVALALLAAAAAAGAAAAVDEGRAGYRKCLQALCTVSKLYPTLNLHQSAGMGPPPCLSLLLPQLPSCASCGRLCTTQTRCGPTPGTAGSQAAQATLAHGRMWRAMLGSASPRCECCVGVLLVACMQVACAGVVVPVFV